MFEKAPNEKRTACLPRKIFSYSWNFWNCFVSPLKNLWQGLDFTAMNSADIFDFGGNRAWTVQQGTCPKKDIACSRVQLGQWWEIFESLLEQPILVNPHMRSHKEVESQAIQEIECALDDSGVVEGRKCL